MKKKSLHIITLSLLTVGWWLFAQCQRPQAHVGNTVHDELLRVEQFIDENPDSAQFLLYSIVLADSDSLPFNRSWSNIRLADASDLALYGLLYTEVLHKRGVKGDVDSLIGHSVAHYEQTGEQRRLCKSLLHRGISLQHLHRLAEGTLLMKRAETIASEMGDDLLTFDVQMALGDLNRQVRCRQLMMDYYRRALTTARHMNHAERQGAALDKLSRAFLEAGQADSARFYVGQGLALSADVDRSVHAELLASKGCLMMAEGKPDEAERLLLESLECFPCSYAALHLGNLYSEKGDSLRACDRWAESLQALDTDIRVQAYRHLIGYYEHHEQWRALDLSKHLNELYEQTSVHEDTESIADMQAQYDSQEAQRRLRSRIWWLGGGCAVLAFGCWLFFVGWRRKRRDYQQVLQRIEDLQTKLLTLETEPRTVVAPQEIQAQENSSPSHIEALQALLDENLVYWFHRKADAGRQPDHDDWQEIATLFDHHLPGFVQALNRNETLSERDVHICMLIKLRFQPSEIATLVGASPQSITNSRTRLLGKIFGEKGGARDFDRRIRDMGS